MNDLAEALIKAFRKEHNPEDAYLELLKYLQSRIEKSIKEVSKIGFDNMEEVSKFVLKDQGELQDYIHIATIAYNRMLREEFPEVYKNHAIPMDALEVLLKMMKDAHEGAIAEPTIVH